jgi:hypothetical protein
MDTNVVVENGKIGVPSKVTVSFDITEVEIVELLKQLIRSLDPELKNMGMIDPKPAKIAKPRKVRIYTDEDRAKFRARMVAAREAKLAKENKLEPQPIKNMGPTIVPPKPVITAKSTGSAKKLDPKPTVEKDPTEKSKK